MTRPPRAGWRAVSSAFILGGATASAMLVSPAVQAAVPTCFGKPATIVGTPGADEITGTDGVDVVVSGAGNDTVSNAEYVCAGGGDDAISGSNDPNGAHTGGDDHLSGGPGNDSIYGYWGVDYMIGGRGDDLIWDVNDVDYPDEYDPGTDVMKGGPGNDTLKSWGGSDKLFGQGGADYLQDTTNMETFLYGGRGRDHIFSPNGGNGKTTPNVGDVVSGGRSRDTADVDRLDIVVSVEDPTYWAPTSD